MHQFNLFVLALTFLSQYIVNATAGIENMSLECKANLFPVTSGGSGDEKISCTVYDEVNKLIIVAGNSTGKDYVQNGGAFAYALDLDGNWVWGKSFINGSSQTPNDPFNYISTISGCIIDENGMFVALGKSSLIPIIMELNPLSGDILRIISISHIDQSKTQSQFTTFGAIHHEIRENDGNSYYYTSFIRDNIIEILKINSQTLKIKWNYIYVSDDRQEWKVPAFLARDKRDDSRMYLIGQFNRRASFIKFNKHDMYLDWQLQFREEEKDLQTLGNVVSEIYSYAIPNYQNFIFGCGAFAIKSQSYRKNSVMMKIDTDGKLIFMKAFKYQEFIQDDSCRQIVYDEQQRQAVFFIQSAQQSVAEQISTTVKPKDIMIVIVKDNSQIYKAYTIDLGSSSSLPYKVNLGGNSLFMLGSEIIFGAYSNGFITKEQKIFRENLDSHVFRLNIDKPGDCFQLDSIDLSSSTYEDLNADKVSVYDTKQRDLFIVKYNQYDIFNSLGTENQDLLSGIKIPKMCASVSVDLPSVEEYYIGQNNLKYSVSRESKYVPQLYQIDGHVSWIFSNGSDVNGLMGNFSKYEYGGTFNIQTNSKDADGKIKTTLRGCSSFDELIELYLEVNVKNNTVPKFKTDLMTRWYLNSNETYDYYLPTPIDNENNDELEIQILNITDKPGPPFLSLLKFANYKILRFSPDSIWQKGQIFYFQIVLKEKNSDYFKQPFNCSVIIIGARLNQKLYNKFKDQLDSMDVTIDKLEGIYENEDGSHYVLLKNNSLIDLDEEDILGDFDVNFNTSNTQSINVFGTDPFHGVILKYNGTADLFFFNKTKGYIQIEDSLDLSDIASFLENDINDIFGALKKQNSSDLNRIFYVDNQNKVKTIDVYIVSDSKTNEIIDMKFQIQDNSMINGTSFQFVSFDGKGLIVTTNPEDGSISVFDLQNNKLVFKLNETSENLKILADDNGFTLYLDDKMIVFMKNETDGNYQKYEFDFEWPENDDFSGVNYCSYNQLLISNECNDCPEFYGKVETSNGSCQHCSEIWDDEADMITSIEPFSGENITYHDWSNFVAWSLCGQNQDELYGRGGASLQSSQVISLSINKEDEDSSSASFLIALSSCLSFCGLCLFGFFRFIKNKKKRVFTEIKDNDESANDLKDYSTSSIFVPQELQMDAKDFENEKNLIDYHLYLYELDASLELIRQNIEKEVKMQDLKMKDKAIERYLNGKGHNNLSLKERAALRRKARQLKKELENHGLDGVFNNIAFNELVNNNDPELDKAEKELNGFEDQGLSDYHQLLFDLDASLELIRQNIEKEVKMQNLIMKDKAIQRHLNGQNDNMSLRERAALRRKARQLKRELDDEKIFGIFDNSHFTNFVKNQNPEVEQAEEEVLKNQVIQDTVTCGSDDELKTTSQEQIRIDFYRQMQELDEFHRMANLQIDAEIKMQSLKFKEKAIHRFFKGKSFQDMGLAKRAALRKKANQLKKDLKEKEQQFDGLLDQVQYDDSNPFMGEAVIKQEKLNNFEELEKIIEETHEDENDKSMPDISQPILDAQLVADQLKEMDYQISQAKDAVNQEIRMQNLKLKEKAIDRSKSKEMDSQVVGLADKAKKRKEKKFLNQQESTIYKQMKQMDSAVNQTLSFGSVLSNAGRNHILSEEKTPDISEISRYTKNNDLDMMKITATGSFFRGPQKALFEQIDDSKDSKDEEDDRAKFATREGQSFQTIIEQ